MRRRRRLPAAAKKEREAKRRSKAALSPPATPAPLPFAQRSLQLPSRVGLLAPIQVSFALVVGCAAFAAELYTDPASVSYTHLTLPTKA